MAEESIVRKVIDPYLNWTGHEVIDSPERITLPNDRVVSVPVGDYVLTKPNGDKMCRTKDAFDRRLELVT